MRFAILLFLALGCAGCSKCAKQPPAGENPNQEASAPESLVQENPARANAPQPEESRPAESRPDFENVGLEELRAAAEAGVAPAQRELAARMLFGKGMAADPAGALVWVERAAMRGDPTAALWMGRKHLNDPPDRVTAAAWFLVAADAENPAVREDGAAELQALAASAQELERAKALKAKLAAEIARSSK